MHHSNHKHREKAPALLKLAEEVVVCGGVPSGAATATSGKTTCGGINSQQSLQTGQQTNQDTKNAVTTGINTNASSSSEGAVSGPGVGVGTATNGKPIGSPGSGLGPPENPVDARKLK